MAPKRIQLSRAKGWRMPPGAVKVDRTTPWGNPFKIGEVARHPSTGRRVLVDGPETSIALYRAWLKTPKGKALIAAARSELKGRDLACWCAPGKPCHGDVLLKVVNRSSRSE